MPEVAVALNSSSVVAAPTALPVAHVLAQYRSGHVVAYLQAKPARVAPILLQPATQPQLIVQLAGTVRMGITRQNHRHTYQARPGSVFLNTAQQLPYELDWQGPPDEVVRSIEINLAPSLLRQAAGAAGLDADRLELVAEPCLDAPLLQQLGYSLAAALQAPGPADPVYIDTVAHMLATELVHRHSGRLVALPARRGGLSAARLRQIHDYVQASLRLPITLESLAAIACLSPYHFSRVFRQATGLSPHQYVIGQRLERARHLLRHGHHNVGQVAREVGYQSASHFARLFQRYAGVLPTELLPGLPAKG